MNRINDPGKFEGEMEYIEYFYNFVRFGSTCGANEILFDSNGTQYDVFILTDDDRRICELDSEDHAAIYYEDDSGFGYCPILTYQDYDAFIIDIEAE